MSAFSGLKVIDCSTVVAAPMCAQLLGDFGADVIKIEDPQRPDSIRDHGPTKQNANGETVGLWAKVIGRNKRTMGLNLRESEGAALLCELVADADVLIENFRPGTLERWGVGPEDLHRRNPRLIILRLTGWGQSGPYASRPGFGTLAEAMSGFAHLTGQPDGPPTLPPLGLADSIAGITAAFAVTTALYRRESTQLGQVIDVSVLEPIISVLGPQATWHDQLGKVNEREGNRTQNNAPRNLYRTGDGSWVAVSSSSTSVAERIMDLVGRPDIAKHEWFQSSVKRADHVDEIDAAVGDWIARHTTAEVLQKFEEAEATVAPVYNIEQLRNDPHVVAIDAITTLPDDDFGTIAMQNVLFRMSESPGRIRFAGRAPYADTDAIMAELGHQRDNIDALRARSVIR